MTIRNFTTKDEKDCFQVKLCTSLRSGKLVETGFKVSFGESNMTSHEARKLSEWLMRAAQVCDEKNGRAK